MNKTLNILVTNNHLVNVGGSETFTYALIDGLKKKGHNVEYFTFEKGLVSTKIENELKVPFLSKKEYDIVFANHNTTISYLKKSIKSKFIQTCHGIFPPLEQPHKYADGYISISQEVQIHLNNKGYNSTLILNGIDCKRFKTTKAPQPKLKSVLSLCQSKEANTAIQQACNALNLDFEYLDKNINPIWDIENTINNHDLVIGLGRSIYEAMACGRPVLIYDNRSYADSFADGYLNKEILNNSIKNNCSGRYYKYKFSVNDLVNEIKKYNYKDGQFFREFALKNLNIEHQLDTYLEVANNTKVNKIKQLRFKFKQFRERNKQAN
ncbi:hypothetical protein CLV86_2502 [Lacinutrix venerupis]|uniref:glycosyltransferase n=1 Tax=Lacinutrix venerupis TaxID=1486034 RepID=UPI000EAB5698|nr:UDP-glycosyltransferase [Lacinutrix venerupis]RLJ61482.1 hypothetical protein CLV86_2502 [Lacinutrix venerupis]